MPRTRPETRLHDIVDAATTAFMRSGYRRARIDEVAELAGVAPATIHLYAATKEALFDLVVRKATGEPVDDTISLPHPAPERGTLIESLWHRLEALARFPALDAALRRRTVRDARAEFRDVVLEIFRWLARYWRAVRVVEMCARDWPELAALFYKQLRRDGLARLTMYLDRRAAQGHLRLMPDSAVAARIILETVAFFAMHRHTAPDAEMDDAAVEATVMAVLEAAFLPDT